MKVNKLLVLPLAICCVAFTDKPKVPAPGSPMIIESLSGPVTKNEIDAFKNYMANWETPKPNSGNSWVFGNPGKAIEACGMMYEVSHDKEILDKMILLSDVALSGRDDILAADKGGQLKMWTGSVEPVWPFPAKTGDVAGGGGTVEGATVGHICYCAYLILQTPAIWNDKVSIGDPNNFGATYKERAIKYLTEGDYVIDHWIMPHFIRTKDKNHYYFPGAPNTYKANEEAPWNQAWLLTDGFTRLALCHRLLNDQPERLARYIAIGKSNVYWFIETAHPNRSAIGSDCRVYPYSLAQPRGMEDTNHFAYDSEGLVLAYNSGLYGLKLSDIMPFANTYIDVVLGTVKDGKFAGRVDGTTGTGHGGGDDFVRDEYIYWADIRPDAYQLIGNIEITRNKVGSSPQIAARLLWVKNRRHLKGL
ncbi:alpha-1,2-mannosidase [Mucilaginibacter sp. AW1-3]